MNSFVVRMYEEFKYRENLGTTFFTTKKNEKVKKVWIYVHSFCANSSLYFNVSQYFAAFRQLL